MAIRRVKKSETPDRGLFDFDDSWTAPFQPENLDDLDDIFMMSSHESSAESRAEDEESLYSDALSRKASIVRALEKCRVNERVIEFCYLQLGSIHQRKRNL